MNSEASRDPMTFGFLIGDRRICLRKSNLLLINAPVSLLESRPFEFLEDIIRDQVCLHKDLILNVFQAPYF